MTIVANTFLTYSAKGIREDLTDVIWNISPYQTPGLTAIQRTKATQTLHEWQRDALDAADNTNAQLEGDDVAFPALTASVRLGNYCQISNKPLIVSRTLEKAIKAGRKSEVAYQAAKKGKALRTDLEKIIFGTNQARAAGNSTTARTTASVLSWLKTNTDKGAGGSDPSTADGTGTRTDGTTRAFLESQFKSVMKNIFSNSGEPPDLVLLPAGQKQNFSSNFSGNSSRMIDAEDRKLVASIDVYTGDFTGDRGVRVMPDIFMRSRDALVLNTDLWAMAWFDPIQLQDLAKTGDATKKFFVCEYALEARNEAGSGGVFDLS